VWRPIAKLRAFPGNPRRHPEAQISRLMKSTAGVWTNPLLIDEAGTILAGHGRLEAAKRLGRTEIPTITRAGLPESEKRKNGHGPHIQQFGRGNGRQRANVVECARIKRADAG